MKIKKIVFHENLDCSRIFKEKNPTSFTFFHVHRHYIHTQAQTMDILANCFINHNLKDILAHILSYISLNDTLNVWVVIDLRDDIKDRDKEKFKQCIEWSVRAKIRNASKADLSCFYKEIRDINAKNSIDLKIYTNRYMSMLYKLGMVTKLIDEILEETDDNQSTSTNVIQRYSSNVNVVKSEPMNWLDRAIVGQAIKINAESAFSVIFERLDIDIRSEIFKEIGLKGGSDLKFFEKYKSI